MIAHKRDNYFSLVILALNDYSIAIVIMGKQEWGRTNGEGRIGAGGKAPRNNFKDHVF